MQNTNGRKSYRLLKSCQYEKNTSWIAFFQANSLVFPGIISDIPGFSRFLAFPPYFPGFPGTYCIFQAFPGFSRIFQALATLKIARIPALTISAFLIFALYNSDISKIWIYLLGLTFADHEIDFLRVD